MHRWFTGGLFAILAMSAWSAFADDNSPDKPFEIGVVPYVSTRVLVTSYEPMRLYLEQVLGKPVKIYTATGFKQFFLNAKRGDYDLVISPANFARILQKEHQFRPLVRYSTTTPGMLMTALNSPLKTLQDLRGQVIAVPDKFSMVAIVGVAYLRENGLQPGTDFQLLEVPSFASAILAVQKGDATAAFSARAPLSHMPPELRDSVRPIVDIGEYFSLIFLANPRLEKTASNSLKKVLLEFGNETNEGKLFLSSTGFGSIIPATTKDMNSLDRYMAVTKRLLADETN